MDMKATTLSTIGLHRSRFVTMPGNGTNNSGTHVANSIGRDVTNGPDMPLSECAACHNPIKERYLLKALDQLWHEDCLKCACCDCRLGEVGSTLFSKANLILCKRDYLRLFGTTGLCSACNKSIPAFEMVMRVRGGRVYHLECFQCSQCNHRFCIGDRFHLHDNRIFCEYDFEELSQYGQNIPFNSHIEKLKKQTESLSASSSPPLIRHVNDDGSSGYGSPDSLLSDGK